MIRNAALALTLFGVACCGYSVRALLPPHLKTIAVLPVENQTIKPNLDVQLTAALLSDFQHDGSLRLVDPDHADITLQCQIDGYDKSPQSYTTGQDVNTWRITLGAKCDCEDKVKSAKLWNGTVSVDVNLGNSQPEEQGISDALTKLSAEIVRRTLTAW